MKAAIITGAGSGIGKATALEFSKAGYFVYLLGRNKEKLEETALYCKAGARRYGLDLASEEQILKVSTDILSHQDTKIEILVNNAGIFERHGATEEGLAPWRRQFETNLFGAISLTQKFIPHFQKQKQGSIVNVSSTLGLRPSTGMSAYSATKAALNSWSQCMALELAPAGIRVNVVAPGLVETPIHGANFDRKALAGAQPLGRVGTAEEIAKAIVFLAGTESAWTTGAILSVDGGINLT